jgi:NCAIR mutase (PurE)-related protein
LDENELTRLLEGVKAGAVRIGDAVHEIKKLPFADMGFAKVDHHRELRTGYPEVIFCPGKTTEQIKLIAAELLSEKNANILATRANREIFGELLGIAPDAEYSDLARTIAIRRKSGARRAVSAATGREKTICVVSAGTADLPVAEEAAVTAEIFGNRVERVYDVGVAGLHRLLSNTDRLAEANVLIVAAGMEGALASVIGGLVDKPVIAVPTSVGYGASFGGLAALLAMLNSCAGGVGVVNIDNGFGAGYLASVINHME